MNTCNFSQIRCNAETFQNILPIAFDYQPSSAETFILYDGKGLFSLLIMLELVSHWI